MSSRLRVAVVLVLVAAAGIPLAAQEAVPITVGVLDLDAAAGRTPGGVELVALRRIFQGLGIGFDLLSDTSRLGDYRVVYTAGALVPAGVGTGVSNDLYDYAESGGTLVSAGEVGVGFRKLFGLKAQSPSRGRYRLSFSGSDASLAYIDNARERTISLGNGEQHFFDDVIWTHGAELESDATALGRFDDGSVGFSVHRYGRGLAYLIGMSWTESVLLPQSGGSYNAERQYANGIEPSADVVMLILKAIYESRYPVSVSLSTVPFGLKTALVLTHDVDAQSSFLDSLKFADLERRHGVKSTFFITTKYFTDETDIGYYEVPQNLAAVRTLAARGWDIGSHTVSHLPTLGKAPEGSPSVTRKSYTPQKGITVWGEVRVSKEILDSTIPGQRTIAYRSGDLAFPDSLIRVLQGAGYSYDSTYSANAVLSAFPYFALVDQVTGAPESPVVEIPVTLDDSQGALTPSNIDAAVADWLTVIRANARYGGTTVLLMHPSDTRTRNYKLRAQEAVMKAVEAMGGWIGDLTSMGKFWRDRSALAVTASASADGTLVLRLNVSAADLAPTLSLNLRGAASRVQVVDRNGKVLPFVPVTRDGTLVLGQPVSSQSPGR